MQLARQFISRRFTSGHGSKAGYTSEWLGSTPEWRRPRIRFSLRSQRPGGSGNHGPNQLLSGRVRPVLNGRPVQKSSRFCCFRTTTPAVAEAGRGHKTIARKSLYKTKLTYTDQMYGRKCRRNRSSRSPRGFIPAEQAYPVLVPGGLGVAGRLDVTSCLT
jgi:hypothetical protein